eukprot:2903609-Pyramimonas_sp.AAC.1
MASLTEAMPSFISPRWGSSITIFCKALSESSAAFSMHVSGTVRAASAPVTLSRCSFHKPPTYSNVALTHVDTF